MLLDYFQGLVAGEIFFDAGPAILSSAINTISVSSGVNDSYFNGVRGLLELPCNFFLHSLSLYFVVFVCQEL